MVKFFVDIYDKLVGRKWLVWTVLAALLFACVALALRMNYQEDIAAFLPVDKQTAKYSAVYNNMGGQEKIVVNVSIAADSEDNSKAEGQATDIETIEGAMDAFGEAVTELDTIGCVKNLQVQVDESNVLDIMQFIWSQYPYLLTDEDYVRMDSLFSNPQFIRQQLDANRQMLMLPTSGVMSQSLPYDPLHLSSRLTSGMQNMKVSNSYQLIDGYIFAEDNDTKADEASEKTAESNEAKRLHGLVFLETPYGISESSQNARLAHVIDDAISKVESEHSGVTISAVGAPLIAVTNASQIKTDSILAVVLAVVLIAAVLIYAFRRLKPIMWIGISILVGWLFALGSIALFRSDISIIVLGIGSVIIGIAVNYPLHFMDHLKHEPDRRNALKEMVPPLLIGNITTVSAFLCLVFLDANAMCDLGLFGSLMLIGTILFVLIALPVLAPTYKVKGATGDDVKSTNESGHTLIPQALRLSMPRKLKMPMLLLTIVVTAVLGYFSLDTSFDSDLSHINYMTDEQRSDLRLLSAGMEQNDSTALIYAVAEGTTLDEALRHNEQLMLSLQNAPYINKVSGIGNLLPSAERQQQAITRWQTFWHDHHDAISQLQRDGVAAGFSATAFSPFIESTQAKLTVKDSTFFAPVYDSFASNFIMHDADGAKVVNFLTVPKDKAAEAKAAFAEALTPVAASAKTSGSNAELSDCTYVFDQKDVSNHLVDILSDSFNYIGFVCGFVVFFFLWLSFGRLELSLLSFLPLAVSWLWILGMMSLCSVQFNIVNIILATFIFGQGDDYTIFITEGLMYEYATGKKTLQSYKNSVMLSAVIMFIGIGTLIFARHPALRSLAEVAIIGMITVVVMAYYLPPLVFRWITTTNGNLRDVPLTLKRIGYSLFSLLFFLCFSFFVFMPYTIVHRCIGRMTERRRLHYHEVLQRVAAFVIRHVPGTRYTLINTVNEAFERPAVIICNHQSHLDVMCILALHPKIVILTNDWVWNNPFYGLIIHTAEFYPTSDGMEQNIPRLQDLVSRGYSVVIFPEGTRTPGRGIGRFHKGAFELAKILHADILPMYLHGLADILPKRDFMLREGAFSLEIGQRMAYADFADEETRPLCSQWHKHYLARYAEISRQREDIDYVLPYIRYKYMYKGMDIWRACQRALADREALRALCPEALRQRQASSSNAPAAAINITDKAPATAINITDNGQGEHAWLCALLNPDRQVTATFTDADGFAIATHCSCLPKNLEMVLEK